MFYFCSMWFHIFLALVLSVHSFMSQRWQCSLLIFPELLSWDVYFSTPNFFVLYLNLFKRSLFFFFQIRVSFTFANSTSCLECLLSFSYLIFLSPSLLAPLKCTVVNSMELRSGCWSILKTKVSHLVKSEGRQSVSSLPSHEEDLHCPMSFQPQEQRKFSQHIQPFRLFS